MNTKIPHQIDYSLTQGARPGVTASVLIFSINNGCLEVIITKRLREPFKGTWSVPGGLIHIDESLDEAARRVLYEKTGISELFLEQLYTFGDPKRDPRERRITVAYYALLPHNSITFTKEQQANTRWASIDTLPKLAFDHAQLVAFGVQRIKSKIGYSNIVHGLLPEAFRLSELQKVYEIILEKPLDKRNFRKKMLSLDLLEPTGNKEISGSHRPAMLYKFKTKETVIFD